MAREKVKTLGMEVGEVRAFIRDSVPGWIPCTGKTIGKATGDYQGDSYVALFEYLWGLAGLAVGTSGAGYKISSAKGASAQADWDAGKQIWIDLRDQVVRAAGTNNPNLGAQQDDASQGHRHNLTNLPYYFSPAGGGGSYTAASPQGGTAITYTAGNPVTDGVNGTPRTAAETRVKNVAHNLFIKY